MPSSRDERRRSGSETAEVKYYRSHPEVERGFVEEEDRSRRKEVGERDTSRSSRASSRSSWSSSSRSRSRSRSRDDRRRSSRTAERDFERREEKPWFKKKTLWGKRQLTGLQNNTDGTQRR